MHMWFYAAQQESSGATPLVVVALIVIVGCFLYTRSKSKSSSGSCKKPDETPLAHELQKMWSLSCKIADDYAKYITQNPPGLVINDVSCLPHPKELIEAAVLMILRVKTSASREDRQQLIALLLTLANFLPGVGNAVDPEDVVSLRQTLEEMGIEAMKTDEGRQILSVIAESGERLSHWNGAAARDVERLTAMVGQAVLPKEMLLLLKSRAAADSVTA